MKTTFISELDDSDDMHWLREVHLPGLDPKYQSAVIFGNEDCPDRITVYEDPDPLFTDAGVTYALNANGDGYEILHDK
jgi:hypothetical protein